MRDPAVRGFTRDNAATADTADPESVHVWRNGR
jgi:hypothetical protein